jgi:hypothetical protein
MPCEAEGAWPKVPLRLVAAPERPVRCITDSFIDRVRLRSGGYFSAAAGSANYTV